MGKAIRPKVRVSTASALVVAAILALVGIMTVWQTLAAVTDLNPSPDPVPLPTETASNADPETDGIVTLSYFTSRAVRLLPYFKSFALAVIGFLVASVLLTWLAAAIRRLTYSVKVHVNATEPLPPMLTYPEKPSESQPPADPSPPLDK